MTIEELAMRIQRGESELFPELWERVKGWVRWKAVRRVAASRGAGGADVDDLVQCGAVAMIKAVETFNPVIACFMKHFSLYLLREYTVATDYKTKRAMMDPLNHAVSMDATWNDDKNLSLRDVIPDRANQYEELEYRETMKSISVILADEVNYLPTEEREVIMRRYYWGQPTEEIVKEMVLSPRSVRLRETKALKRLRRSRSLKMVCGAA